jgi:hypothetical protein
MEAKIKASKMVKENHRQIKEITLTKYKEIL